MQQNLAIDMIESSEILRTKWKGLKDSYKNYQRKAEQLTGGKSRNCPTYQQWCWAENLQFIEKCGMWSKSSTLQFSKTSLHLDSVDPDKHSPALQPLSATTICESTETLQDTTEPRLREVRPPISIQTSSALNTARLSALSSKKRWKRNYSTSAEDGDTGRIQFKRSKRGKSAPIDLLFKSYAETFRTLSAKNQVSLKLKLAKLFADAEIEEMAEPLLKCSLASVDDEQDFSLTIDDV